VKFLVLIPALNEGRNLPKVIAEIRHFWPEADILVVDDASEDDTAAILPGLGVR